MQQADAPLRVAVVGPCASGKSTVVDALRAHGYDAHHPAQEHSGVPDMWQRRVNPDVLVFLDVSIDAALIRRPLQPVLKRLFPNQRRRLEHARTHCDLYIDTSPLTAEEVIAEVRGYLDQFATL